MSTRTWWICALAVAFGYLVMGGFTQTSYFTRCLEAGHDTGVCMADAVGAGMFWPFYWPYRVGSLMYQEATR